ncbi:MAG: polysulfide reductase NrfD [Planctomycetes bacterium]|nr:polysulfide reductase NrfD [Planctomycetota bacterium]
MSYATAITRDRATAASQDLTPGGSTGDSGRFGTRWWIAATCLLSVVGLGLFAYARQASEGLAVTGMRTVGAGGAAWGLYIVGDVFFIGVSFAGITIAALIRLLGIASIRPLSRAAELLTITALVLGAFCVMADLGQPLKGLLYLPMYARPMSPFFGTFSLVVGGYLFASCVYFFLAGRADAAAHAKKGGRFSLLSRIWAFGYKGTLSERVRHHRVSFWLSLVILPLLVTAHSTLGFIFGTQGGRPGWFNALAGPGFVVMAGVSGIGVLIVIAAALRKFMNLQEVIRPEAIRWLGNLLLALVAAYLYFMVAEEMTANYAAVESETRIAHEVVFGAYSPLFWTVVASLVVSLVVLFVQFVRQKSSIGWTVFAGVVVNVAALGKRILIVVPSLTHGMLLPYEPGSYMPSWVEVSIFAGLLALGILIFMVFTRIFPIIPSESHHVDEAAPRASTILRPALFLTTLAAGVGMAVVGFLYSARYGTEPYSDPVLPFAPLVFIAGIVTCLMSAVVYELVPDPPVVPQLKEAPAPAPLQEGLGNLAVQ